MEIVRLFLYIVEESLEVELAVLVFPVAFGGDGLHHVPMLGNFAVFEQFLKSVFFVKQPNILIPTVFHIRLIFLSILQRYEK